MVPRNDEQLENEELNWKPLVNWTLPKWTLFRKKYPQGREIVAIWEGKDWVKAFLTQLPGIVAALGFIFGIYQFNAQQKANVQLQVAQQVASEAQTLNQQDQTTFDTYLDRMSDLLLIHHLQTSQAGSPVRAIAEARTTTALHELDPTRRAEIIHFLWKAELAIGANPVVSLNIAPLSPAVFQDAFLNNINLSGAVMYGDSFIDCDLQGAFFIGTNLIKATLDNVNLTGVNMTNAILRGASMDEEITLTGANLTGADLQGANLSGDDLTQVTLTGANLAGANLQGALITPAQLKLVASLQGAIMPDGSKHP